MGFLPVMVFLPVILMGVYRCTAYHAVTRFQPILQTTMFSYSSNLLIFFKSDLIICQLSFIIWFSRKTTTSTEHQSACPGALIFEVTAVLQRYR